MPTPDYDRVSLIEEGLYHNEPIQFHAKRLAHLLRRRTIATMPQLKKALGTSSDATVFRKLRGLSYLTSYTHSGRYYTLEEIPSFDSP